MASSVHLDFRPDGVAVLTLDQPGSKVNVLTEQLWADLEAAIDSVSPRADVKGLVIASGKPGVFIAGADLKLLGDATGPNDPRVRAFIDQGLRVLEKLESLPFPTCAAIDGVALGGGFEVALACDCRLLGTHPKIQIGMPEVKLGLIPGWGGTQRLPRVARCGMPFLLDLLTTGRSLNRDEAVSIDFLTLYGDAAGELANDACTRLLNPTFVEQLVKGRRQKQDRCQDRGASSLNVPVNLSGAAAVAADVIIAGAALPLADAIRLETAAFLTLAGSSESKRLIAEFFARRASGGRQP